MPKTAKKKQRKNIYAAARVRDRIACRHCGAAKGEKCWNAQGKTFDGCHRERHVDYERQMGKIPKRGVKGLVVRYVCPICGGPHPKAEHPRASA